MSFEERLAGAVREAVYRTYGVELNGIHVERPNDPAHGDFATNVALANARVLRRNPREVAQNLVDALEAVLDRVLDGDDVDLGPVDLVQGRIERC